MINIERHFDFSVVNRGVRILVLSGPHVVLSLYLLFNNIIFLHPSKFRYGLQAVVSTGFQVFFLTREVEGKYKQLSILTKKKNGYQQAVNISR